MDSYKVIVAPKVLKDLKHFPQEIVQAIWHQIKSLQTTPRPSNCKKLKGSRKDEYRLKIRGNYRLLYEIFDKEKIVHVLRVLDRKEAYR